MADRKPFEEKYKDLPTRWNIKAEFVNYIIRRYEKKLKEELESLKEDKIKLSRFFRDRRTDEEYVYDLIDGWLVEDIICDAWLRDRLLEINPKIEITHMGTNRERNLQKFSSRKIGTEPDFIYKTKKGEVKIELQMAREVRKEGYDMKESKVKRALKEGNLFLWVILPGDLYFFCDPAIDLRGIKPQANPLWGGKMTYRIDQKKIKKIGYSEMKAPLDKRYYKMLKLN